MKFTTDTRTLLHALEQARAVVPTNPTLVAYASVMLQVKKTKVDVVGSDGDTTVSTSFTAGDCSDGCVFLPPAPLYTFLRGAGDRRVGVAVDGDIVVTAEGLSSYRFRPVTTTFPNPTVARGNPRPLAVDQLRHGVDAVRHAAGRDLGILVQSRGNDLTLYGTDHYRLHVAQLPGGGFGEFTGAFTTAVLHQICDLAPREVLVDERSRTLTFRNDASFITTRTLAGDYPRVEAVLEQTSSVTLHLSAVDAKAALGRLGAVSDGDPVNVNTSNGKLVLTVDNPERGSGSEQLPYRGGEGVTFLADRTFLIDALSAHGQSDVMLEWGSALGPVFLRSGSLMTVVTVIMPIRSA